MSKNFYIMQRGWMDNEIFTKEPFTEREAFQYLIEQAAWKDRPFRVGNQVIKLRRGQLTASYRYLAEAWQWNKNKVAKFLEILTISDMIGTEVGTAQTIITICNYSKYQDVSKEKGTDIGQDEGQIRDRYGTDTGQIRDKTNQDNQDNQDNHFERETEFLEWYEVYPKAGNAKRAREEFSKARQRIDFDELMKATHDYAEYAKTQEINYIKSPHNWLMWDCWTEPIPQADADKFDPIAYIDSIGMN